MFRGTRVTPVTLQNLFLEISCTIRKTCYSGIQLGLGTPMKLSR